MVILWLRKERGFPWNLTKGAVFKPNTAPFHYDSSQSMRFRDLIPSYDVMKLRSIDRTIFS